MRRWAVTLTLAILLVVPPSQTRAEHLDTGKSWRGPDLLPNTLQASKTPEVGEALPRIVCPEGFQVLVYATDLKSPGGLAFDPSGVLHVAEENVGRVSRIESGGTVTPVVAGLDYPEGITFDPMGNLYVVEDVENGRLLRIDPRGQQTILVADLDAPEGVVWSPDDQLYVTESNAQFVENLPWDVVSGVTRISQDKTQEKVFTDSVLWSYSGITLGVDGFLYVANEASNVATTDSIFRVDPLTGERVVFTSDLTGPEGLAFSPGGAFPLFATEEDLGDGFGRLSLVTASGGHRVLCTGFRQPEGVAVDTRGNLYVTDLNLIVQVIAPDLVSPGSPWQLTANPSNWTSTNSFTATWQNPDDAMGIAGAYLKLGTPPTGHDDGTFYPGEALSQISGITVATPGAHSAYLWLEDGAGNTDHTTAASVTLHYDPDAPDGPLNLSAKPGGWSPADQFSLSWTNPADISGVLTACYRVGAPPLVVEDHDGCQAAADIQGLADVTTALDSGEHAAYVWLGDTAGNVDPSTAVGTTLRLDAVPPLSLASAPDNTETAPIRVTWIATDTHSGLGSVTLWVKKGDTGSWTDTGQTRQVVDPIAGTAAQGSFLFQPTGKSTYYFGVQARDQVGNAEAQPSGNGEAKTECETWQRVYLPLLWKATPTTLPEVR
jgi:sugar lactone lactonase YvrE